MMGYPKRARTKGNGEGRLLTELMGNGAKEGSSDVLGPGDAVSVGL